MRPNPKRLRLCGLSLAAATAACLEIPPPVTGTDAAVDASDASTGVRCGETSSFATTKLQTIGATAGALNIREAIVGDVNGDDIADLVLLNADVPSQANQKVFVLLGPLDPSDPDVHAEITTLASPAAVSVTEMSGDSGGCLDLAVFGANKMTDNGFIELYVNAEGAGSALFEATPATHQTLFRPAFEDAPTFIVPGRFGADTSTDFVVADLTDVALVSMAGVPSEGLTTATSTELVGGLPTMLINGIFARPNGNDATIDDLVIVEHADIHWVERDGGDQLTVITSQNTGSGLTIKGSLDMQVDVPATPDDPVDIFGAGASSAAVWRIADDTPGSIVLTEVPFADPNLLANNGVGQNDGDLDEVVTGQLAQGEALDVVIIDRDLTNGTFAVLILDVRRSGATLPQTDITSFIDFTNFNPRVAAVLDADNDGDDDVYVIDPVTGEGRCLEVNASLALVSCS